MLAFTLAVELAFVAPTTSQARDSVGAFVACASPDTMADGASFRVYRLRQSPTWVAKRDSMLSDDAVFARLWPTVAEEGSPHLLTTFPFVRGNVRLLIPGADTAAWYSVATVDTAGNEACWSPWAHP